MNVRFLEYSLRRVRPFLEFQEATQTAQKNINLQVLRPLLLAIPSRREQDEVVGFLNAIEVRALALRDRQRSAGLLSSAIGSQLSG